MWIIVGHIGVDVDDRDAVEAWRARAHAPETGIVMHDVEVTAFEIAGSRPPF